MAEDSKADDLVRLNVAAKELGVASKTVKKYCRCQILKCEQLPSGHWRIRRSSLDDLKLQEGITTEPAIPEQQGVYFVRCQEFVKIGRAGHVGNRIRTAQTFIPWPLELVFMKPCATEAEAIEVEALAHAALAPYRHRGEWFMYCSAIRAYIDALAS